MSRVESTERTHLMLTAGALAASWWLAPPAFALGLGAGALIETLNFRGLHRQAEFLFWGEIRSGGGWVGVYALRFGILVIGIGAALWLGADPAGLLVGLSLIMPAAVIEAWRNRPAVDPAAPALDPDAPEWDRWDAWLARERPEDEEEPEAS